MWKRMLPFSAVVALTSFLLAGCPLVPAPGDNGLQDDARSIDGYWLAVDLAEHDALTASSFVEYWYVRTTGTDGDAVSFEITDACNKDEVLVRGTMTPNGTLHFHDDNGGYIRTFAEFIDDHEIVGTDWTAGHRLVAQRIAAPECSALPGSDRAGVHVQPLKHVVEDDEAFVALEAKSDQQQQDSDAPNGLAHLEQVRGDRLPLGDDYDQANNDATTHCHDEDGSPIDCPESPDAGHAGLVECSVQNWSESRQRQLADVVALGDLEQVYPGALLEGDSFVAGSFAPITIPRAGGRLTLHGLTLSGPPVCPDFSTPYTACVDEISFATVNDAVANILQNSDVQGTAADASHRVDQVYSAEQFAFKLGVDVSASGLPASIAGNVNVDQSSTENLVVMQFVQVYYTVSFEPPQHPYSVFREGRDFDDPDDQIGAGNPPLYVSSVKYGRQVFLFLRSSYGATLIEAALNGAANAEGADVKIDGNLTYRDVMSDTSVTYVVRGGDAGLALAPIDSAANDPQSMYDAIRSFLSDPRAANFSASSPGVPVAYTLRYLVDNKVAMTSYATTYDRRDCRTYPPTDYQYHLRIRHPKQSAWIYLDDPRNLIAGPYRAGTGVVDLDLNQWLTDAGDHTLIIQLYARCLWESAAAHWELHVDGARRWSDSVNKSYLQTCQIQNVTGLVSTLFPNQVYEARLLVSRRNGKVQLVGLAK